MAPATGWWQMAVERRPFIRRLRSSLGTVRLRTTLGAVAVVGVALAVAGVALTVGLRESLINDRREVAEARADEIVAAIEDAGDPVEVGITDVDDQWVQVVNSTGAVVASSENAASRPAVVTLEPDSAAQLETDIGDDRLYIAAAAAVGTPAGQYVVIVGRGLDDVVDSTDVLTQLLVIALPALLLLVGVVTYVVVGRALRPVDEMRREVDGISARGLERRVAVPAHPDELSRLAATMNRMLDRLQAARDRQRRFVSDAAHELRSPVASIRQHAEVALAHPSRAPVADLAAAVLDEDLRLQRLVEDLILLARLDERSLDTGDEVDLDDIVFGEASRLRATTKLDVDTANVSACRVLGDAGRLRRMVSNLADNAARHGRSRVAFSLRDGADGTVVLTVDDDGGGIPAAERERVFERFVRLDDARARDDGGSGLGLAIVAEVANAHGGSASAHDSPSTGARIEVRLPRAG